MGKPTHLCTLDQPMNFSSHDVILSTLQVNLGTDEKGGKFTHTYSDFKREKIVWDDVNLEQYKEMSSAALVRANKFFNTAECIPLKYELFSNLLVSAAKLCSYSKPKKKIPIQPPGISGNLRKAKMLYKKNFQIWKCNGRPRCKSDESYLNFLSAKNSYQSLQ